VSATKPAAHLPPLESVRVQIAPSELHPGHYSQQDFARLPPGTESWALTFLATDRYRMSWATIPIIGDMPDGAAASVFYVKARDLVSIVKTVKKDDALGHLEFDHNTVTLEVDSRSSAVPCMDAGQFPSTLQLIAFDPPGSMAPFAVQPSRIAQLGTAATRLGSSAMALSQLKEAGPIRVALDGPIQASALLMPYRIKAQRGTGTGTP
jgi:hypothetical protein